jgi:formate dehydrogenase subunit delta
MDINRLVGMANRVGDFFEALPDTQEGMEGVAGHIGSTWEARMRIQLATHLDGTRQTGLTPFVDCALRTLPSRWRVAQSTGVVSPRP